MASLARPIIWQSLPIAGLGLLLLGVSVAVALRELSWGAGIVAALFGTIVLGFAMSAGALYREGRHSTALRVQYPDKPWMWDARWQTDHIPSRSRWDFIGSVFTTVILSLLAIPMFFAIPKELSDGNPFVFLGFLPIAVAAYFARYAFRRWRSNRFEKQMSLFLTTRPAFLGAEFSARLVMPDALAAEDITVRLEHLRIVKIEESDGTTFSKRIDHQAAARIDSTLDAQGQRVIGIAVDVPAESFPTAWANENSDSYWDLVIDMRIGARPFNVRYAVPVAL